MFDKYVLKHKTHLDLFTKVKSLFKNNDIDNSVVYQ